MEIFFINFKVKDKNLISDLFQNLPNFYSDSLID